MAGIYIHIPFCKKACSYCDFHFTTQLSQVGNMVDSIIQELEFRKDYLEGEEIETIYFGGGTPSLLSKNQLEKIFLKIYQIFKVSSRVEITLEANPDDLNLDKILTLKSSPINRISLGIQSFFDEDLQWMNRSHNSLQAKKALINLQDNGLTNINIDLIFGYPLLNHEKWNASIQEALHYQIPHLSTYGMTIEKGTLLFKLIERGTSKEIEEELYIEQFTLLMNSLKAAGYIQYEISNFAKDGYFSKHNSSYWAQKPYLGIGPSAHSYNQVSRSWNIPNNWKYIEGIKNGNPRMETEILLKEQKIEEYIITSLRTYKGISLDYVEENFGKEVSNKLMDKAKPFIKEEKLIALKSNHLVLSKNGKLICDFIIRNLF